jgi:hypothetical protein
MNASTSGSISSCPDPVTISSSQGAQTGVALEPPKGLGIAKNNLGVKS